METGKDTVVKSWLELQEVLFNHSWDPHISRFRSSYVYRGACDKDFNLNTSIMRIGSEYDKLEPHLLRNFRK